MQNRQAGGRAYVDKKVKRWMDVWWIGVKRLERRLIK